MKNFVRLITAGPMFFVSSWLLMLFAGAEASHVGIHPFGYITSMIVTIGLWLAVAPAIAAVAGGRRRRHSDLVDRSSAAVRRFSSWTR